MYFYGFLLFLLITCIILWLAFLQLEAQLAQAEEELDELESRAEDADE